VKQLIAAVASLMNPSEKNMGLGRLFHHRRAAREESELNPKQAPSARLQSFSGATRR
jgi:hypothetical protein